MLRSIYRYGIFLYMPLVALAAVFYLERTAFIDVAFIFFKVLWTGDMAIQGLRYGSAITQMVPWAGGKLGLSLNAIAMTYSVWAVLWHFTCYLLCGAVFKNYKMALVLLCSSILFVSHSFYWIQSELPQGLPFMAVVLAWMSSERYRGRNLITYILLFACFVTITFFHPLMFIPTIYLAVFLWLSGAGISKTDLAFIVSSVLLIFLTKVFLFSTSYDSKVLDNTGSALEILSGVFSFETTRLFFRSLLTKYQWIPILSTAIVIHFAVSKKYLKLLLFVASMIAYLILVHTAFRENIEQFYMENLYLPLSFFIAAPLVYDLVPVMRPRWSYALLLLLAVTGIGRIYLMHKRYTVRLHWAEHFLEQHRQGKWVYDDSRVPMHTLMMNWGTPYEFWMLSTIKYDTTASIVVANRAEDYIMPAFNRMDFLTTFESVPYDGLRQRYFKMTDTISRYTIMGTVK